MPTIANLTVDVTANTSKFSRGMRTVTAGLGLMAAGAAFAFKQFEDSQKVMNQTQAVLKSTSGAANVTAKEVDDLATAISMKTGIDDEAIQSGENLLLTFKNIANEAGKGNDIFNRTTQVVTDMSVAMGQDFKSSAIQVGKALNDPIAGLSSLSRVGVTFTDQQKRMIEGLVKTGDTLGAQKVILHELTSEFGGSAEAQATASGKMSVAFGNLAESIGAVLAPTIEKLVGWVTTAAEWFTNLDSGTQTWITTAAAATAVIALFAKAFGPLIGSLRVVIALFSTLAAHPIVAALIAFAAIVALVATNWDKLNGIVKVGLTVISPFGVLIGLLIRTFDDLKETAINVWNKIIEVGGRVVDWVRGHLVGAWDFLKEKVGAIVGPIVGFIQDIIDAVKTLIGWLQDAVEWFAKLPLFGGGVEIPAGVRPIPGHIPPSAQHGGIVTRSGLAMIHRGEVFSGVGNEMGFGGINGDIVLQVDGQTFARITRDQLRKLGNRNAGTGL